MDYRQLDGLFNPSSIAVVGVTEDRFNLPLIWLQESEKLGYRGILYAVSRRDKIGHHPTYQRVADIPGPVDLCIVGVPAGAVPLVLEECVAKGVPWVVIMTSGFSETGRPEGRELEEKVKNLIKGAGTRVIGPNCVGPYCPATGLAFERDMSEKNGEIAFVSQSGALSILLGRVGKVKGLGFSKVISYGNESDLPSHFLFEYLAHDPDTKLVAAYLEGVKDSVAFTEVVNELAAKKPVIILKGGTTEAGVRAVTYHTGADAASRSPWEDVFRKPGVTQVASFDELVDTLVAFTRLPKLRGNRVALISPSGGMSVKHTDISVEGGFQVPELSRETIEALEQILTPGTSARNPLDLAGFSYFDRKAVRQTVAVLDADERIDAILFHLPMDFLMPIVEGAPWFEEKFLNNVIECRPLNKPLIIIMPHSIADGRRAEVERLFLDQGFAVFPSVERALRAAAHVMARGCA
ncbi:MAG: CoA-binding protein [Dehalococcoidia bacterium]|nr:CoA-binding protein [Dehalococcoidia bacterium]